VKPLPWTADEVAQAAQITAEWGANVEDNWPRLWRYAGVWNIQDPRILVGLIGNISKESGRFDSVNEAYYLNSEAARNAWYADTVHHAPYEGGIAYHGRGPIQLTHLSAYAAADADLKDHGVIYTSAGDPLDLVANPNQVLDREVGFATACSFFVRKPGMLQACLDQNWRECRRLVFGAYSDTDGLSKITFAANKLLPLARERGWDF